MAGEQINNEHKTSSAIIHHVSNRGDDDEDDDQSEDLILNAISERTDKALALINSCDLFILNNLRQSSNNRSLLHICVGNGWCKAVVQLLKRSVDVNIVDAEHLTPLMLALSHPKTDILKNLLAYNETDINYQRTHDGFTVLHLAMINDRDQHFKILLQHKTHPINFNLTTNSKKNFLHLMADMKCKKCFNVIRKLSLDDYLWQEKDNQGYTPLLIALIRWPYSSFTRHVLLLLLGLSSNSLLIEDNHGKTILHWSIFNHRLVKLITNNRWLRLSNIKDNFGKIPFDYAYDKQLFKSVQYLRV